MTEQNTDPAPSRWQRVRTAAGGWWAGAVAAVDRYDITCALGLLMLLAGLCLWFGPGPAFTVGGLLVLALGVAGAKAAGPAAMVEGG